MRFGVRGLFFVAAGLMAQASLASAQAPTVTVSGVGYAQYLYQLKVDSTLSPPGHQNNFDVTRAYINVIGKFTGGITTRVTADIDGRKAAPNQQTFRLKYAYVAWTPEKSALTYKIGQIHTPFIDWEEALWDYRMQGTMAMERNGYLSSADLGAGVDGNWAYDKVNMQVGVYNGENYNNTPGDQRKEIEGRVSVRLIKSDFAGKVGGLRLTGYGDYGIPTGGGAKQRFLGMLSYKSKQWTLAGEYAITKDRTAANPVDIKGSVLSVYGVWNVPKTAVGVIGRVDVVDPNRDSSSATPSLAVNKQTRVIAGVSYQVTPNLRVMGDVDLNSLAKGSPNNAFDRTRQTAYFHTQFTF
jgi:hypothetical protein